MSGDNALVQTALGFACSRLCKFVWLSFGRSFNGLSLFSRHVTRYGTLAICLAEKLFQTPLSSRNLDHHENAEPRTVAPLLVRPCKLVCRVAVSPEPTLATLRWVTT